jgi:hypothetical protein
MTEKKHSHDDEPPHGHDHPHKEDAHKHGDREHGAHGHDHGGGAHVHGTIDPSITASDRGLWAVKWSFVGLFITTGLLINYVGISPIRALFWTAVINGLLSPPLLVLIMLVSNNKKVMGERVNGVGLNFLGWAATAVMFAAAIGLFLTWGD